ncbi:hypothetical protein FUA23_03030 [Neolewinella aurantiaca]|uniref:Uncharacterized protein n=1 Tax=Neolewinella aurantiaca TaxID=2602767 RepID=A0A5C7FJ40_9BACT|nr:hypothetical protein [Neolewinella aurantiaca]TXF91212.1 hypothetical protein FUA23_03030 [Neolewinella aurantiaca]
MPKPQLALVALSLLFFACGGKDATAFDPSGQEWEFSLSNPLPINENLKVPEKLPLSLRLHRELFSPGDILEIKGDSVMVNNETKTSLTGMPRMYRMFTDNYHPDTLAGLKLSQGVGTTLSVAAYYGDSLRGEWVFEAKKNERREIAFGELTGQTFSCAFPGGDTMQVHFGVTIHRYGRKKGEKMEYFVEESSGFRDERSYLKRGGMSFGGDRVIGMRDDRFSFISSPGSYSSKKYTYSRDERGTVIASYFEVENGRYERVDMPLVLRGPVSADATEMDFADRINSGIVTADTSYAPIDSSRVSYAYQDDYKGIEFDELSELEFSAIPGGEFIVVVRDRLLMNRKWRLSSDGNYLITLGEDGNPAGHYPILAYTDEHIDLRMPFTVKTREPRGVALESYATISVFIRIAGRMNATSR